MLAGRLPRQPVDDGSQHFMVGEKIEVDVLPRKTPMGNKPYAKLSHSFERPDGVRISQGFAIDAERVLEVSERVRDVVAESEREGLFRGLASRVARALGGTPDRRRLDSFAFNKLEVQVV